MWFLLEYDSHEGKLQKLTPFPESDHAEAMSRLAELERSQLDDLREMLRTSQRPRMEYVMLARSLKMPFELRTPITLVTVRHRRQSGCQRTQVRRVSP